MHILKICQEMAPQFRHKYSGNWQKLKEMDVKLVLTTKVIGKRAESNVHRSILPREL